MPDASKLQTLIDRQEIYDCLLRISRGSDRSDKALVLSAFHPDAICDVGERACSPEELFAWSAEVGKTVASEHHHLLNFTVEIDDDVAHAETYYFYIARVGEESNWVVGGRYVDRFERRDGAWKIALRYNLMEWTGNFPSGALPFSHVPDLHANGAPARGRDDPSYRRPLDNRRTVSAA